MAESIDSTNKSAIQKNDMSEEWSDVLTTGKRIAVVGRSGNGKTSVIKSLNLSCDAENKSINVNQRCKLEVYKIEDFYFFDYKGIGDCSEDLMVDTDFLDNFAIGAIPNEGFHAIVFVLKYGVRFTKQEMDAVKKIRHLFGDNNFQKYVVVVLTYGDNLDREGGDMTKIFDDWCHQQTGEFQMLLKDVSSRCLLFDNKTISMKKKQEQKEQLIKTLKNLLITNSNNACVKKILSAKSIPSAKLLSKQNPKNSEGNALILERLEPGKKELFSYLSDKGVCLSEKINGGSDQLKFKLAAYKRLYFFATTFHNLHFDDASHSFKTEIEKLEINVGKINVVLFLIDSENDRSKNEKVLGLLKNVFGDEFFKRYVIIVSSPTVNRGKIHFPDISIDNYISFASLSEDSMDAELDKLAKKILNIKNSFFNKLPFKL